MKWLRAAAGLVVAWGQVWALNPDLGISQYHKQYWQVEQGLPHSYVTAVRQAADGYLLVGSDEGLVRFDGVSFRGVRADASLGLSRRWVSALLLTGDGSTWIGLFDGQIVRIRDGKTLGLFQTGGSVFDLIEGDGGTVWASTRNGVFRVEGQQLKAEKALGAPLETSWNVFSRAADRSIWVVTSSGLHSVQSGAARLHISNGGEMGQILSIHTDRGGVSWIGTTKGLFRFATGGQPVMVQGVKGPVVALLGDRDGTLWAGTWGLGIFRVTPQRTDSWTIRDGLSDDFIRTLAEDNEGNIWIGTRSGGLGRWRETRIVPYGGAEGLAGNYATTVAADPKGDLWLGTWRGGLYRLRSGKLESQPLPLPTLYFTVRALAFDQRGHQWIGNWEGLFEFDGRGYQRYGTKPDSPYHRVSSLLFGHDGALWVGTTDQGVFRFEKGRPADPALAAQLAGMEITALFEDTGGTVWAGTSKGLARLPDGIIAGLPQESIESVFEDSKHRVWASTSGGALIVSGAGKMTVLDKRHGLPEHPLYRVVEDARGEYWVSSPHGILEINGDSIQRVLAGKSEKLQIESYGQDEGMRTIECHGLSQPSGGRDAEGGIWFPTARGFVKVRQVRQSVLAAPKVAIEEIRTDAGPVSTNGPVELAAGTRNIALMFSAFRLSSPRQVMFRYRMVGFDPGWVMAGQSRSALYNQLPPGTHRFELQGRDPMGEWSSAATIEVKQLPRFHQTWWFVALLAAASIAIAFGAYRWHLLSVRTRYEAVIEERNRIGREWHDTLVAGFSAISLQLEAAESQMGVNQGRAQQILDITRKMVHHYRAEARRVIWDLRDNRPEGETLSMAVEDALKNVMDVQGIAGKLVVEGEQRELPLEMQQNVLRICQEAIANAARHGAPSSINVTLAYEADRLRAVVQDDGCGFDADPGKIASSGHYGMVVMQERAKRYGGELRVRSRRSEGTTVEAWMPVGNGKRA